jgi:hypothetical protein
VSLLSRKDIASKELRSFSPVYRGSISRAG